MFLENSVVVITGGGQGIGRDISLCLARHGASVVIADINEQTSLETKQLIESTCHAKAVCLHLDVTNEDSVADGFREIKKTFGKMNILVNNSGVAGPMGPTENISLAAWQKANAINLDGVFLMCKYGIPLLRESSSKRQGNIINISSVSAKRPLIERASYCSAKAAIIGLTRSLALECGQWNVRVNTVCPGAVDGPRQRMVIQHAAEAQHRNFEDVEREKKRASPLNTFVPSSSIADVVAFLCSDAASMMTGQDINVSAGAWMC